jgi:hypothetical protein
VPPDSSVEEILTATQLMAACAPEEPLSPAEARFLERCEVVDAAVAFRCTRAHSALASVAHPTLLRRTWRAVEKLVYVGRRDLDPGVLLSVLRILTVAGRNPERGQAEFAELLAVLDPATQALIVEIVGILGEATEDGAIYVRPEVAAAIRTRLLRPIAVVGPELHRPSDSGCDRRDRLRSLTAASHAPPVRVPGSGSVEGTAVAA